MASDPDNGDHITWSIVENSHKSAFKIDPTTGALSLKRLADDDKTYTVTVKATDSSGTSDMQTIKVKVADDHKMFGKPDDETFVFLPGFGKETVKNFDPADDVLQNRPAARRQPVRRRFPGERERKPARQGCVDQFRRRQQVRLRQSW
jgi:hypothetical protein